MGSVHVYICQECGKSGEIYLGVGMLYPSGCEEAKLSAITGKMGIGWQKYVIDHPNGGFDCENAVFVCSCGGWRVSPKLDYYVLEDDQEILPPYFTGDDEYTGEIKCSRHRCPKCMKNMHKIPEKAIKNLRCPHCGGKLDLMEDMIMWD